MTGIPGIRGALAALLVLTLGSAPGATITFEDLLDEASMTFSAPEDFSIVPLAPNPIMNYEKALRRDDAAMEIRYAIRPIARATVEYEDPHNAAPDPNHLYAMMFRTLVDALAAGGDTPLREYPADQAREKFNADWAAAAVFDVDAGFSTAYKQGLLIAMHKNEKADAYEIFLFDDYTVVKAEINANLGSLRFK